MHRRGEELYMQTSVSPAGMAEQREGLAEERPRLRVYKLTSAAEVVRLMPLARAWHAESRYAHLPLSERKVLLEVMTSLRRGDKTAIFLAEWKGEVVGCISLAIHEAWLCDGGRYATCLGWFVHPEIRRTMLSGRVAAMLMQCSATT
jgi:hypothetical protein